MTELQKMTKMLEYIGILKTGKGVSRARISDDIKLSRTKLKDGTMCVKVLIKIPREEDKC